MKHRLFAAIDLPDQVASRVVRLQTELDKLGVPIVWEKPKQLHLTLVFMGRLPDEDAARVRGMLVNTARAFRSHTLRIGDLDTLYNRHELSILFLQIIDLEGELVSLQKELARRVDEVTPQPRQKFMPHITIGRIRKSDPTQVKHQLDKLADVEIDSLGEFTVDKVHLYESFLSKSGASYIKLASFNLGNS